MGVGEVAEGEGLELEPSGGGVEGGGEGEGVLCAGGALEGVVRTGVCTLRGGELPVLEVLLVAVVVGVLLGVGVAAVGGVAFGFDQAGAFDVEAGGVVAGAEHDEGGGHEGVTFFWGRGLVGGTSRSGGRNESRRFVGE